MPQPPRCALVMCVRDEERFLAANLAYHRALGVWRAYLFLDRCTDASARIARSFPWVTAIERDRDPRDRFMSVYQVKCQNEALQMAREDGADWLLHVDADEFACGDDRSEYVRLAAGLARLCVPWRRGTPPEVVGSLPRLLAAASPQTEMVVLRPKDVLPVRLAEQAAFWKLHYCQLGGLLRRPMLDPTTGRIRVLEHRLGHAHGKSAVRVGADVAAASAHRWQRRGVVLPDHDYHAAAEASLATEHRGFLYHFTIVSGRHWREKHRKFAENPDHWVQGKPVRFPKQAWKEASVAMSEAEAQAYFDRWVAVRRRRLLGPMLRGQVTRETFVDRVLARIREGSISIEGAPPLPSAGAKA